MNMIQLKDALEGAIAHAKECGVDPASVEVSLQIDAGSVDSVWAADDMEFHYDNDGLASGAVITAWRSV